MPTSVNPIAVTTVSSDRELLLELSWTLSNFGYRVTASTDWSEHAAWRRSNSPTLCVFDARDDVATQAVVAGDNAQFVYRIAVCGADARNADALLESGFDDVVVYPLNIGELLTRLRCGVRRIEFERRFGAMSGRDCASGLLTTPGLLRRLGRIHSSGAPEESCVVAFRVDLLDVLREQCGAIAADELSASLGHRIGECLGESDLGGVAEAGAFVAVLLDANADRGHRFAEDVLHRFASGDTATRLMAAPPTVSGAVSVWRPPQSPQTVISQTTDALDRLPCCGGNCVLDADDILSRLADWRRRFDSGEPFEQVVAKDLMLPFPAVAREDEPAAVWGDGPQPLCVPAVDRGGALLGVVDPATAASHTEPPLDPARIEPTESTIDKDAPLNDLFESFSGVADPYLIVLDGDRPIGYLSAEGLASLVVDPINESTYRVELSEAPQPAELIVPMDVPQAAGATA